MDITLMQKFDSTYQKMRQVQVKSDASGYACIGSGNCCNHTALRLHLGECENIANNIKRQYWVIAEREGEKGAKEWYVDLATKLANRLHDETWDGLGLSKQFGCAFLDKEHRCSIYEFRPTVCFAGEEKFITMDGEKSFKECLGQKIMVLGEGGNWQEAEVQSFGQAQLYKLTIHRNGTWREVFATKDHVWVVKKQDSRIKGRPSGHSRFWYEDGGYRCTNTSSLLRGDGLQPASIHMRVNNVTPSPIGIMQGFVFGDGTEQRADPTRPASIQIFQNGKDEKMLSYFSMCKQQPVEAYGDGCRATLVKNLPRSWKYFPPLNECSSFLYGWLIGYFAADGRVAKSTPYIESSNPANIDFVKTLCLRLGIRYFGETVTDKIITSHPGKRQQDKYGVGAYNKYARLWSLALDSDTLGSEFFIHDHHKRAFEQRSSQQSRIGWTVDSVEATDRYEEVFCVQVKNAHPVFALDGFILTHNCRAYSVWMPEDNLCPRPKLPDGSVFIYGGEEIENLIGEFEANLASWNNENPGMDYSIYYAAGILRYLLKEDEVRKLVGATNQRFWLGQPGYPHRMRPAQWDDIGQNDDEYANDNASGEGF